MTALKLRKSHTMLLGRVFETFAHNLNQLRILVCDKRALDRRAARFSNICESIAQCVRQ